MCSSCKNDERRAIDISSAQMQSAFMLKLEAEQRKLISVESQQIIAIVDDGLLTLQIASRFASICESYDYFEHILGPEIVSEFQHLRTALNYPSTCDRPCANQKAAEADAEFVASMTNKTSSQKLGMHSAPAMKRIRGVVKNLARLISEKRDVFNSVCLDSKPSPKMSGLLQAMEELRRFVFERLHMTQAKEKEQILFLEEAPTREKALKGKIEELEWELSRIKLSTADEVRYLTDNIAQLEDDIEKMIMISSEHILQKRMDMFHDIQLEEKSGKDRKIALESEYQTSLRQYDKMLDRHRHIEYNLRKKNFIVSFEVENWIMKYDKDMSERMITLETLSSEYTAEKEKLVELEYKFAPVEEVYKVLMAEKTAKEQARLAGMLKEVKYLHAAVVIQKYIRGFLGRKRFKQLKKKKKEKPQQPKEQPKEQPKDHPKDHDG